mmetsp:Transcript_125486/g.231285  ORF Transcript_125486/g.231285 Transcript_125486/m.231285 type:complete len:84 (+) Transcript_125486:5231-5482(+)
MTVVLGSWNYIVTLGDFDCMLQAFSSPSSGPRRLRAARQAQAQEAQKDIQRHQDLLKDARRTTDLRVSLQGRRVDKQEEGEHR